MGTKQEQWNIEVQEKGKMKNETITQRVTRQGSCHSLSAMLGPFWDARTSADWMESSGRCHQRLWLVEALGGHPVSQLVCLQQVVSGEYPQGMALEWSQALEE